jgi:hypothetical protein
VSPANAFSHGILPIPAIAAANGLSTIVFFDHFLTSNTFDLSKTGNPGYNWYLNNAWPNIMNPYGGSAPLIPTSGHSTNPASISVSNSVVTLSNSTGATSELFVQTAQAAGSSYVGQGFTPPMYVEWSMAFTPSNADASAWPIVWLLAIESLIGAASLVEVDGYEYYLGQSQIMEDHFFNSATTSVLNNGNITGISDSNFHKYGALWLPANGATNGVIKRYLDGAEQTGAALSYATGSNGAASDANHSMLIMSPGDGIPVSWDYIGVWT